MDAQKMSIKYEMSGYSLARRDAPNGALRAFCIAF
jgi:hypothetical protein